MPSLRAPARVASRSSTPSTRPTPDSSNGRSTTPASPGTGRPARPCSRPRWPAACPPWPTSRQHERTAAVASLGRCSCACWHWATLPAGRLPWPPVPAARSSGRRDCSATPATGSATSRRSAARSRATRTTPRRPSRGTSTGSPRTPSHSPPSSGHSIPPSARSPRRRPGRTLALPCGPPSSRTTCTARGGASAPTTPRPSMRCGHCCSRDSPPSTHSAHTRRARPRRMPRR